MGKRNATRKPKQPEKHGHHGCGSHHGLALVATTVKLWWALASCAPRFLYAAFCASLSTVGLALDHPSWAYWAYFANLLDLVWRNLDAFLLTLGSIYVNLQ